MGDNSAAKSHLRWVESTLSRIDNMWEINAIINETSLRLNENLSSENLFIDEDIVDSFNKIINKLNPTHGELITNVHWAIQNINNNLVRLSPTDPWNSAAIANLNNKRYEFQHVVDDVTTPTWNAKPAVTNRYTEYINLRNLANSFDLNNNTIPNITVDVWRPHLTATTNLNRYFSRNPANLPRVTIGGTDIIAGYSICDENWNKLRQDWSDYIIEIWWWEHRIIDMNITAWELDLRRLRFDPPLTNLPQEITLSISSTYSSGDIRTHLGISHTNMVRNKTFKLILNDWSVLNTSTSRGVEFDRYDSSWTWNRIWSIIETQFTTNRHKREREALTRILEKNWGAQYATLNDKQKEDFYQRIRNAGNYFDNILRAEAINSDANRFNGFRTRFIDDGRDWNKGDNIKSNHNYIAYIHNNVSQKVWEFISSRLDHFMWDIDEEASLKSELTTFINEIENNKLHNDNTVNNIYNDLDEPEHQMDRKRHWYQLTRRKDANYMRFFSWSSTSLKWEVVDVHTNTRPEELSNLEPVKYDMDIKISWRNSIEAEIKIEWEKKPIRIKSWDPAALVRKIMRDGRINHWNARAHMWFNVYKALVKMANEKDISLQYRNENTNTTRYIDINDWNIVVREVADIVGLWRRNETIIFDQQKFIDSNNFGLYDNNGSLRRWIDELWKHFTFAMNQLHDQYRHWIERKFWTLFNSRNRLRLPASFWSSWLSPIKKLVNLRDVTNFDFNTTVTSKWKNVNIKFSKNKFTINMEWLEKPIVSKDLWKILNKRHKKIRIFDGMERDIVEWIYATLIGKLRENSKIANTDFWVMDNITWNMYVLDRDWKFWMIYKENLDMMPNPLRWEYWRLNHDRLEACTVDWFERWSTEEKELMKNPFLMQRLVKAMNRRLARPWR